jgi:pimeloyl-ACP methyl ester carboxylesterase
MTQIALQRPDAVLVGSSSGEGPTALLLHAGGEHRGVWEPVAERLVASGFRAVSYDLRGHGKSGAAGAERLAIHAEDVAAMLAAERGPVTIVGASLGGLAGLLALREPDVRRNVGGFVLVDVVPHLDPDRVRAYLNQVSPRMRHAPLVADVLSRRRDLEACAAHLADLPTLLVRGARSQLTDEDGRWLTSEVASAEIAWVFGAGHLVARDAPAELAALLVGHLNSPRARRHRIDRVLEAGGVRSIPHLRGTLLEHLHRTADTLEASTCDR